MTISVMLDLETWGKRPGCDIRSIGAVVFDPVAGSVSDDTFYIATNNPILTRYGGPEETEDSRFVGGEFRNCPLHRDPETVQWWSNQSHDAQAAFDNPVDLRIALIRFGDWLESVLPNCSKGVSSTAIDLKLWANDPHFDVSILAEAYHAVGLPVVPWHYRAPRSMRTVVDLSGLTRDEYVTATVEHHALYDAIAQAGTVCKCYSRLGLTRDSA
jgi:hypothetical protein